MKLIATPELETRLLELKASQKFIEEDFYPGAPTERLRSSCEARVNEFIVDVLALLNIGTDKDQIFSRTRVLVESFDEEDTEERERVDDYIGETMEILAIDDWIDHL